ncbi:hypothetical protein C3486_03455 [Streptomyces sp. Ru73]|nr:hypothetical protein C3486_03455 [Streptomyces sp. Ru73]
MPAEPGGPYPPETAEDLARTGDLPPPGDEEFTVPVADAGDTFVTSPNTSPRPSGVAGAEGETAAEGETEEGAAPQVTGGTSGEASGEETDGPALERQLSLLTDIAEALSSASSLDEGLQRVCKLLSQQLADWSVVDLLDESDQLQRVCISHRNPWELPAEACAGRLPPVTEAARGPLARVLRGAGPLLLTEAPSLNRTGSPLDTRYARLFAQLGAGSALIAPLRVRGAVFGALTLARTDPDDPFTDADLPLIDGLVRNLSLGVENARLYQETRQIAERLQHSLLPVLPEIPHLQMAARYAPSSMTAQIGGDWYDSFRVPNGDTALVIGDVTGHDLEAAIAMSQLRSMLRGIAIDRHEPPGEILRRLDMAQHSLHEESTATCIYALVSGPESGPWELKHSSAGHLPPLLTTEDGDTRYLGGAAGLLLGMDPDLPRPHATDCLPPHSTVLLYTDGLIERRDESLNDAMARLRRHTAALARKPLDVFCDELLIALSADNADDIALLAVRPVPRT